MREVLPDVDRWLARGEAVALATVVRAVGSAPRPAGAALAVGAGGGLAGAVSGGCVEGAVVAAAREVLAGGPPRLLAFAAAEDPADPLGDVGLPCGGALEVWVERLVA